MKEQRLLYRLALVLLLGTVLGAGRPGIHNCIAITGALGLILWSFFCRRREAYILLAVFLLGAGMSFFLPTASYLNTETVSLTGTVRDVKAGEDVHRLTVKTPKGRVYVETDESLTPGMRIAVRGQITTRTGSHNPGVFDYENYLWTENVLGILEHDDVTELTVLPGTRPIQKLLGNLSVHGREKILSIHRLSEEHRALLVAMTLGDRDGLTPETESLFRRTMVYHVLAVSGLHVTAVLGAVGHLLGRVRFLKPGVRFGLSVFVMAFYVLLTGAPDSAIRAVSSLPAPSSTCRAPPP